MQQDVSAAKAYGKKLDKLLSSPGRKLDRTHGRKKDQTLTRYSDFHIHVIAKHKQVSAHIYIKINQ